MRRVIAVMGVAAALLSAAAVVVWVDVLQDQPATAAAPVRYAPPVVEIGDGVHLTHAEVAREVDRIVNDPRSWRTDLGQFTLRIVEPGIGGTKGLGGAIGVAHLAKGLALVTEDAWTTLGPRFAAAGGSLEDQRTWIVLHELGHLLDGNSDHAECPAAGQPAPVMRGSTYELDGCALNVWPHPHP